jgi:hypothetical protein
MPYKALNDILVELEQQQRREFTALSLSVEYAALDRIRSARKQLSTATVFFIERSWDLIAPQLETFSLEAESGKSPEELHAYLNILRQDQPVYAWGWIRARMNARLVQILDACVPNLLGDHPEMAILYRDSLQQVDTYWFRETPLLHLKVGYQTALGVACKWYGSALELGKETSASCTHVTPHFAAELHQFASFSLTMLRRTDRYLWDSAGADPLDAVLEDGTLKIAHKAIEEIYLENAPDYGIRIGCPALRARRQSGTPAFQGIVNWVEQVLSLYLPD